MSRLRTAPDLSFLSGATVTRVYLDQHGAGFLLDLGPPNGIYDWRVNQVFHVQVAGTFTESDPDDSTSMMPFFSTLGSTVEKAALDPDGRIRFTLAGRIEVECGSDPSYEAWQLNGPGGFLIVCLPGGGVATWDNGQDSS
ncbi:MAG TPA: DUF6188 family protein [Myxococcales bacterium]